MSQARSAGIGVAFSMLSARWMFACTWPTSGANWRHATFILAASLVGFGVALRDFVQASSPRR